MHLVYEMMIIHRLNPDFLELILSCDSCSSQLYNVDIIGEIHSFVEGVDEVALIDIPTVDWRLQCSSIVLSHVESSLEDIAVYFGHIGMETPLIKHSAATGTYAETLHRFPNVVVRRVEDRDGDLSKLVQAHGMFVEGGSHPMA